jgi:23S rRNA pseudouridine2457 synthase
MFSAAKAKQLLPRLSVTRIALLRGSSTLQDAERVLIAFNKPYGILSQFTPEPGSRWGTLATFGFPKSVYPIGRLDADSEGLLLLSDEPELVERLLDPRHAHPREYFAQVERVPDPAALTRLARGVSIGAHKTQPCIVRRLEAAPDFPPRVPPIRFRKNVPDAWIALELTEGKNRQVRRMTAAIGHPTLRLVRVRIGGFRLSFAQIPSGKWTGLTTAARADVLRAT